MTDEQLENIFTYHPPKDDQPERYEAIREQALLFALRINDLAPESTEKDEAILHLQEVVFWANAAIARNE